MFYAHGTSFKSDLPLSQKMDDSRNLQSFAQLNNSLRDASFGGYSYNALRNSTILASSPFSLCDAYEEPPRVSDTFLQATSRVLTRKEPSQGRAFLRQHEENSQRLAGHHAGLGSEQRSENLKDFLDKKRQECHMALLESEQSSRLQSKRQSTFSSADFEWEKFKEEALMDDLAAGGCGMLELLRREKSQAGLQRIQQASLGDRPMTTEEIIFARVVQEYNDDTIKLRTNTKSLLSRCVTAAESLPDKSIAQLWRVADSVVPENLRDDSQAQSIQQTPQSRLSKEFQTVLIQNARKYLEQSAWFQTETRLRTMIRDPEFRGAPETDTVVAYCRQQLNNSRVKPEVSGKRLHGVPIWALIYYSVRLGALKSAVKFCNEGGEPCSEYVRYFSEYERNKGFLLNTTETEMRTVVRGNFDEDPYKQTVLAILSRDDPLQEFAVVTQSVHDWLWTKLAQVASDEDGGTKDLTYSTLQSTVALRFPPGKTDDMEAYLAFMLTGQFERAVQRLFQTLKWRLHGVHLALSLEELRLLNVDYTEGDAGVLLQDGQLPALNFSSVVRVYANGFRRSNTKAALEYLYHLSGSPVVRSSHFEHEFPDLFQFCVYKLATDGATLADLFGPLGRSPNVTAQRGLIQRFIQDPSDIMAAVAQDLVQDGYLEDGLMLFENAGEVTQLFKTLMHMLADNLTCPSTAEERRKYFVLATTYAEKYRGRASEDSAVLQNFFVALDLMTFFTLCDQQAFGKALQVIRSIKVVPLDAGEVANMLVSYRDHLLPEVRECIPLTILRTAQALVASYTGEKERVMNARLGTDPGLPLKAVNQMIYGARLSDELVKAQMLYKKQIRALLDFTNKIASSQLPNLLDILIKLEASVS